MAHSSPTREAVRRTYKELTQAGQAPTAKAIRARIGRGSLTTIVDELRQLRESDPKPEAVRNTGAGGTETDELIGRLAQAVAALQSVVAQLSAAPAHAQGGRPSLANKEDVSVGLERLGQRLDGMQRHMLIQVNEARELAARWKDRALQEKAGFAVWRDTLQSQNLMLAQQLAHLRGLRGEPLPAQAPPHRSSSPAVVPVVERDTRYPGHPRALVRGDDFEG